MLRMARPPSILVSKAGGAGEEGKPAAGGVRGSVLRAFRRETLPTKVCPDALPGISAFPATQGLLEAALQAGDLPWKMGLSVRLWSGVMFAWFRSDSLGASPAVASLLIGNESLWDSGSVMGGRQGFVLAKGSWRFRG